MSAGKGKVGEEEEAGKEKELEFVDEEYGDCGARGGGVSQPQA